MPIIPFIEQRFPEEISYGSRGGPGFSTDVFTASSGHEQRNMKWSESRSTYDVSHGIRDKEDMDEIVNFFYNVKGKAIGFRFKDFADYQIRDQIIGEGDGIRTEFQLLKSYTITGSSLTYNRDIRKPVIGTFEDVTVDGNALVEGTDFTVDYTTGIITFATAPLTGNVTVGYVEFDVPVRFDIDEMDILHEEWQLETWDSIPLVELKV